MWGIRGRSEQCSSNFLPVNASPAMLNVEDRLSMRRRGGAEGLQRRLRVMVVDDHDVVRWGLRMALTSEPWV